jgi:hypothetical protein
MHSCQQTEHYRKKTVFSHTHKTRTAFQSSLLELGYIGYWLLAKEGRPSLVQTTAKVKCKLLSHCLYLFETKPFLRS